jgi:chromosome segregation ATPase
MSAENVIINFQSDTNDLQKVDDSLDQIIAKDEVLEAQWKKTGAAMAAANKTSAEQTTKLAKSIDQLATASKTLDKSVIAGAYKTYLKDIQAQLGLTQKELVKYVENARKAAQAQIITADDQQAIDELTLSIEVMNEQLAEFQREEEKATTVTKTLKQQLREAKNELAAMAEAGLQGTPAFEELRLKAGELDDQIKDINQSIANTGSDTKNIDGLVSLAGGVAGGFGGLL